MEGISNKTEMYIERLRFQVLIHKDIEEMDLHKSTFKSVASFIYITLITGFFFSWASASDTSNIFLLLDNMFGSKDATRLFFYIVIQILLYIPLVPLFMDGQRAKRAVFINSLTSEIRGRAFYRDFIMIKLTGKKYLELKLEERKEIVSANKEQENRLEFEYYEFEEYIKQRLSEPEFKITGKFPSSYASFILLNECISRTLIIREYERLEEYEETFNEVYDWI